MIVLSKPTGKLVTGDVLDCNRKAFDRALRDYDPQLYTEWHPGKRNGWGCWEVRRLPNMKKKINAGTYKGNTIYLLEYVESEIVNHVCDAQHLDYRILERIKRMDTWSVKNWAQELETTENEEVAEMARKNQAELRYNMKQFKHEVRAFKEEVASGVNPFAFFSGRYKS